MAVKAWIPIIALCWCTAAAGALPGVTELHRTPEEITDREERELLQRDAFERVNFLLDKLGIR